eukprot:10188669-Alexandrium_andersonii.AAC.1
MRPLFLLGDLEKFDGQVPPSWRLERAMGLQKYGRWVSDRDLQVKNIEDAADALFVMETIWEHFL